MCHLFWLFDCFNKIKRMLAYENKMSLSWRSIVLYWNKNFRLAGRCSHIVGLLKSLQGLKLHNFTHVPAELSCTSMPQSWGAARGNKITPVPVNHVVVARPIENRKRRPVLCHVDTDEKYAKFCHIFIHFWEKLL